MKFKNLATAAVIAVTAAAFVIGSGGVGEAKGKKKAAPAPKPSASCMFTAPQAVCAVKGGTKFTYRNACYAGNDGATVASDKACPPTKAVKAGKKKGKKKSKKAAKKPMKK
jgi:hypothetical protein